MYKCESKKTSPELLARFNSAYVYATMLYQSEVNRSFVFPGASRVRRGSVLARAVEISDSVSFFGGDVDQRIAGLFYAVLQYGAAVDRSIEVRTRFGRRVLSIVEFCSGNIPGVPVASEKSFFEKAYLRALESSYRDDCLLVIGCVKLAALRELIKDLRLYGADTLQIDLEAVIAEYQSFHALFEKRRVPMQGEMRSDLTELESLLAVEPA